MGVLWVERWVSRVAAVDRAVGFRVRVERMGWRVELEAMSRVWIRWR
jgi:hypothetical protein